MSHINRLLRISLAAIILSAASVALPVAAAPPGDGYWAQLDTPGLDGYVIYSGSNVTAFAECPATGRVYVVDRGKSALKTSADGKTWQTVVGVFGWTPTDVAVAPDDENVIAVVNAASNTIAVSQDRGDNWVTLPALPAAHAAARIMDVAVSPARPDTLMGHEYAIALADPTANATATATMRGGLLVIGTGIEWHSLAAASGAADFYRLAFSPAYAGDRILIGLSADAAPAGQVGYWLFNTATDSALPGYAPATVTTAAAANDLGAAASVKNLDLALPRDFDPLDKLRAYVSVGSWQPVASDDVYRLDGTASVDLNAVNPPGATAWLGVDSIGYDGTGDNVTLVCGYIKAGAAVVKHCTDPYDALPVWTETVTQPTGSGGISVRPSRDFTTSGRVYAATRNNDSAWSVSWDGGISFQAVSWIDNGVADDWVHVESLAISADGESCWCVSDDGTDLDVWRGPSPPTATGLRRMYHIPGAGDGNTSTAEIHLNPDWAASATVYILDPSTTPATLYVSNDDGATWQTRRGPGSAAVNLFRVVDRDTLYAVVTTRFYRSDNQAWTWQDPVRWDTSFVAGQGSLQVADDDTIFIADTAVRDSSDGSSGSWQDYGAGGLSGNTLYALPHPDWPQPDMVYVCDSGTGRVLRCDGESGVFWTRVIPRRRPTPVSRCSSRTADST